MNRLRCREGLESDASQLAVEDERRVCAHRFRRVGRRLALGQDATLEEVLLGALDFFDAELRRLREFIDGKPAGGVRIHDLQQLLDFGG